MKKIILQLILTLSILLVLCLYPCRVFAADYIYKVDLIPNSTSDSIKRGDSITYDIVISNVNTSVGICGLEASLENADDFDVEVQGVGSWSSMGNLSPELTDAGIIMLLSTEGSTEQTQTIGKLTLTAKRFARAKTHEIKLKIRSIIPMDTASTDNISADDAIINVILELAEGEEAEEKEPEPVDPEEPETPEEEKIVPEPTKKNNSSTPVENTTTSTKIIPKAGLNEFIIIVAVIVTVFLAVISYKKFKNLKNI